MNGCQHVSISFTSILVLVGRFAYRLLLMEADVVRWLQFLRYSVAEESEQWNLFSVFRDSVLDSTIDNLFDFDSSTTSVSDFEYYSMDQPGNGYSFSVDDDDQQSSVSKTFPKNDITVSFKPKWSDVMAWKNELMDSALEGTSSEDEQWFSSKDFEGRSYYFEENSNESSWTLPETNNIKTSSTSPSSLKVDLEDSSSSLKSNKSNCEKNDTSDSKSPSSPQVPRNWPQLWDGHMCVLKEGPLSRTKMTENGKRLRKNWTTSHVILTELFLLFFKDSKSFVAMKNGNGRPELCVDLNGAVVYPADKVSSRKNVYLISTVLGTQVLFQNECNIQAQSWLYAIQAAISNLPCSFDSCPRIPSAHTKELIEAEKINKLNRNKSLKLKVKNSGSVEDLITLTSNNQERQTKIKDRLRKFFHRRPTMESLVKKGIWKDEPAFGCFLDHVVGVDRPRIPAFVQQCIAAIESTEENLKTDGLYRASGNLSQVQKIRLQVDQNNLSVIDREEDVHVLTGALKLFFRELREPLIPYHAFSKAISAASHSRKDKLLHFREITKSLPVPNYDTLKFLLKHLLKVTSYKEFNRMHIPNLAIVFGPTLMWPEIESTNMAIDLMQQNMVIEALLADFDNIFR